MAKSTRKRRRRKSSSERPAKPYSEFPLYAHPLGYWSKKVRGTIQHFGRWGRVKDGKVTRLEGDTWQAALEKYKSEVDDLQAGRKPRGKAEGLTVGELRGRFLTAKSRSLDAGQITARTYFEYRATADRLLATFKENRPVDNLASDDFEALWADIAKQYGPVRRGNEVQRVRTIFKYAFEAGLIDRPVRFGPQFKKPSKAELRKHRATNGHRLFTAEEVRALLDAAGPQLKAMILLGVNCGFGNGDCASLPLNAVDLEARWIRYPRPKTGIDRRCPLWPETVEALKAAITKRPDPKKEADAGLVFVTKYGHRWVRVQPKKETEAGGKPEEKADPKLVPLVPVDSVLLEFGKLLNWAHCPTCGARQTKEKPKTKKCDACGRELRCGEQWGKLKRPGLGFYALRHTFRTEADATKDFPAIRLIMGHADGSIDDTYRETIADSRLQAVAEHVRKWLFGNEVQ